MAVGVANINLQSHPLNVFLFLVLSKKLINLNFYSTGLSLVLNTTDSFYSFSSTG